MAANQNSSVIVAKKIDQQRISLHSKSSKPSKKSSKVKNENLEKGKSRNKNLFKDGGNKVDPLNIKKLRSIDDVSASPKSSSPLTVRQNLKSDVGEAKPVDVKDPLKLNSLDDSELIVKTPKKKKKRKRRHTSQGSDTGDMKPISLEELENDVVADDDDDGESKEDTIVITTSKRKRKRFRSRSMSESDISLHRPSKRPVALPGKIAQEFVVPSTASVPNIPEMVPPVPEKPQDIPVHNDPPRRYREKDKKFIYGNYNRYYGYRNPNSADDDRLSCLKETWFSERTCLDIGCNVGHITLWIASNFSPKSVHGIDIDPELIRAANSNVRHYIAKAANTNQSDFPISLAICHGPLVIPPEESRATGSKVKSGFPYNVSFKAENYVPVTNEDLSSSAGEMYDVITCLSVTKWIHLNWGDEGLKRMFKKMFKQLRPNGKLILEPQPFKSYKKKKNLTPDIRRNFESIRFKPDQFIKYLLSVEIGFVSSEILTTPHNKSKGFQRPLYLLRKSATKST